MPPRQTLNSIRRAANVLGPMSDMPPNAAHNERGLDNDQTTGNELNAASPNENDHRNENDNHNEIFQWHLS